MSSLKKQSSERVAQLAGHLESLLAFDASLDPNPTDSEVEEPLPRTEWDAELDELKRRIQLARTVSDSDPGKLRQAKQGKLMVRDRVDKMLDKNSLVEVGSIAGKGEYNADGEIVGFTRANYVSGYGTLDGRRVVVGGDDFSVRGGSEHAGSGLFRID
jgi:acetyl-CoA carboxylase carboxyltransferase component